MIPTVPYDFLINLIVGLSVAFAAKDKLAEEKSFMNRYFCALLLFEIFVFAPIGFWLYIYYPDWSSMYFWNASDSPPIEGHGVLYIYFAGIIIGYLIGYQYAKTRQFDTFKKVLIGSLVFYGIVTLLTLNRVSFVGDYTSFHSGLPMTFILKDRLALHFTWIAAYFALPLVYMFWRIRKGW